MIRGTDTNILTCVETIYWDHRYLLADTGYRDNNFGILARCGLFLDF